MSEHEYPDDNNPPEEVAGDFPPPPFDEATSIDNSPEPYDEAAPPPPPRQQPRGRPRKHHPQLQQPRQEFAPPGRLASNAELLSTEDVDPWFAKFNWDVPGMKVQLHRKEPPFYAGVSTKGFLEQKESAPYTIQEIQARFGGGVYEAVILGPTGPNNPHSKPINRKRFPIAGNPRIDGDAIPEETRYAPPGSVGRFPGGGQARGADPAREMTNILGQQLATMSERALAPPPPSNNPQETKLLKDAYSEATKMVLERADAEARTTAVASQQIADMHKQNADRAAEEVQRLAEECKQLRERLSVTEGEMQAKVAAAGADGVGMLAQLLPTFSTNAQEQVQVLIREQSAREERLASQYQAQINSINVAHDTQIKTQQMSFEIQQKVLASNFENTIALLKAQLLNMQAEKEHLVRQLEDARRLVDDARKELMTHIQTGKAQPDTLEQFMKFAQLREAFEGMFGPREAPPEEGIADGIDNPVLKSLLKMGDKVMPHVPAILDAFKNRQQTVPQQIYGPPPGYAPQLPQPQTQPQLPQPQPQPQPAYQQPELTPPYQQPQQAAPRKAKRKPQLLKKTDVLPALEFLNTVLVQPEPPQPEEILQMALTTTSHGVLRTLAAREPQNVIANLEAAEMLVGFTNLQDERGKAYLAALLAALKTHFAAEATKPVEAPSAS